MLKKLRAYSEQRKQERMDRLRGEVERLRKEKIYLEEMERLRAEKAKIQKMRIRESPLARAFRSPTFKGVRAGAKRFAEADERERKKRRGKGIL